MPSAWRASRATWATYGPAHFVGHSLGGLLVLETLNRHPAIEMGRAVLLGTPARGCYAGRRIARYPAGRWFLGESEELWREGRAAHWTRREALGVLAGSLPFGLGRLFGPLPGVNDGVVRLEETAIEGMADRVVLPVGHSAMLISARVAAQVCRVPRRWKIPCEYSLACECVVARRRLSPPSCYAAAKRWPTTRRRSAGRCR